MYKKMFCLLNTPTFLGVKFYNFCQNRNNTPLFKTIFIFSLNLSIP